MRVGSIDTGKEGLGMTYVETYQLFCRYCFQKFEATELAVAVSKVDSHELECEHKIRKDNKIKNERT